MNGDGHKNNKRAPVGIIVCAVKIYNEEVTLEEKFELFFKLWYCKGPGNK